MHAVTQLPLLAFCCLDQPVEQAVQVRRMARAAVGHFCLRHVAQLLSRHVAPVAQRHQAALVFQPPRHLLLAPLGRVVHARFLLCLHDGALLDAICVTESVHTVAVVAAEGRHGGNDDGAVVCFKLLLEAGLEEQCEAAPTIWNMSSTEQNISWHAPQCMSTQQNRTASW